MTLPVIDRAVSTAAAINTAHGPELATGATAGIEQPRLAQLLQSVCIGLKALALVQNRAVPVEAVLFQTGEQCIGCARSFPGRVQILHAHPPLATGRARVQVAGQGADQRAEMQRAGRGWGKAADVVGVR